MASTLEGQLDLLVQLGLSPRPPALRWSSHSLSKILLHGSTLLDKMEHDASLANRFDAMLLHCNSPRWSN